jgi:uncharacterized protein (TIGR03086 family)
MAVRVMELLVHSWDLAAATRRSTDIDPELAEEVLAADKMRLAHAARGHSTFTEPQPVADDAPTADRLAGYLGHSVTAA